jgi:hypothetical protein
MAAEIKKRRRGAWPEPSDRRRDAEIGRQGKRGLINQAGFRHQTGSTTTAVP